MIVVDENIPYIKGLLEPFFEVKYLAGSKISSDDLTNAKALIVRTRTHCDKRLLENSDVRFIASATIGSDHVDLDYLKSRGISFSSAPGCNAKAVMQYVITTLYVLARRKSIDLRGKTIGVVGVGNTGGAVADIAEHLGFRVLRNDPPKAEQADSRDAYYDLDYVLENSDIVTCHLPLDKTTRGLVGADFFRKMKKGSIFINSSRGEVVQESVLYEILTKTPDFFAGLILDVWCNESKGISEALLEKVDIATPHIAGYSIEGKANGTSMVIRDLAEFFGIEELKSFQYQIGSCPQKLDLLSMSQDELTNALELIFPVEDLDFCLRSSPCDFERIRSAYPCRREFIY